MKGLGTVFKEVYGKGLEPYGFKRIKGKQPYYVRVVTDEIINIISFKSENNYCFNQGYRRFAVVCGIATIYRPFIDLDKTVRCNDWLDDIWQIYRLLDNYNETEFKKIFDMEYLDKNEDSLVDVMKTSFFVFKEKILPIMNSVNDIDSCIEYYRNISPSTLNIYEDDTFGRLNPNNEDNEGLINFLINDIDKFERKFKEHIEMMNKKQIVKKRTGQVDDSEERMQARQKALFEWYETTLKKINFMKNDSLIYKRIIEEMEFRKKRNIRTLNEHNIFI